MVRKEICKTLCAFVVSLSLTFVPAGCVREDKQDCVYHELSVRVVDSQGNDITSDGTVSPTDIYFFGNNGFVRMLPSASSYTFGMDKSMTALLSVWGNLTREGTLRLVAPVTGDAPKTAEVQLSATSGGYSTSPPDLFYGSLTLQQTETRSVTAEKLRIVMKRCVSMVSVSVLHISEYLGGRIPDLHISVRGTSTAMNFLGEVVNGDAVYTPKVAASSGIDRFNTPQLRTFPTPADGGLDIVLYDGDTRLLRATTDDDGNRLHATPGNETAVTIDFRYAHPKVGLQVQPWNGKGEQHTEFP